MRSRLFRRTLPGVLFCGLLLAATVPFSAAGKAPDALTLSAVGRGLNPEDTQQKTVGRLRWRGGLEISSGDSRFGGLSGLLISADGSRLTAITDQAHWLDAGLVYNEDGDLTDIADARITPLRGRSGKPLRRKGDQDSESLTRLPDGSLWVSFERHDRILHYPAPPGGLGRKPRAVEGFRDLRRLVNNGGLEALVTLADGRVLALSEKPARQSGNDAFLWDGRSWSSLRFARHGRFEPTGAALLPDGDLVILERRFSALGGLAIRLRRSSAADVRPGGLIGGEELALFKPPLTYDNMEGVDVRRGPNGETLVYLIADDNFSLLQRTLLLMFELMPE